MAQERLTGKSIRSRIRLFITALLIIVAAIMMTHYRIVCVRGNSMYPVLTDGQCLIAYTKPKKIVTGDIIVFRKNQIVYIKRVIAIENDYVEYRADAEYLSVNGNRILGETDDSLEGSSLLVVPTGGYFVMGDNYADSIDSRSGEVGFVTDTDIIGVIINHGNLSK